MTQPNPEILWHNGQFLTADTWRWPLDDRGLSLGDGLFETVRIAKGKPCFFADHWARMTGSAKALGIDLSQTRCEVEEAIVRLAQRNEVEAGSTRILLSRGPGPRGLNAPKMIQSQLLVRVFTRVSRSKEPLRLALSSIRRCASQPTSQHKTVSYLNQLMSRQTLVAGAKGNESLLLDSRGRLSCVGVGNLFWFHEKTLYTPSLACAVLPGTMRARIVRCARMLEIEIRQGAYWPAVLQDAEMVFMTNALVGAQPVVRIDLGEGVFWQYEPTHPILRTLREQSTSDIMAR